MRDLLPLAVILPVLAACVLLAGSRWMPRRVIAGIALASVAGTAGLEIALLAGPPRTVLWVGGWRPVGTVQIGVTLVSDRLGTGAALTAALLLLAAAVYGTGYFDDTGGHYPVLLLLFLAGMTGFALTGDLFNLFVFFELMSASAYALTGMKIEEPSSVQGALNFGVLNSLGAYLSLLGVGLIYARTGQLGLAPIGAALDASGPDPLVTLSFALVCVGLLVKAAAVPLHFWLADAHAVAPTPVCVLFSGIMIELGLYGIVRLWFVAYAGGLAAVDVSRLLLVLGVATAVLGAVMCSVQRHLKRLLAYSTVSHSGLFLVALATLTPDGVSGAALYVLGHAAVKAALFLLAGVLLNRFGSVDEAELFGRGTGSPLLAWGFVIGALALAGLPPFGTGLGKAVSEEAAGSEHAWLVGLFVVVSAVTGGSVLRAALRVFFGLGVRPRQIVVAGASPGHEASEKPIGLGRRPPLTMLGPIAVLLGVGLVLGCWPAVGDAVARAAAQFTDHAGYLAAVFGHAAPPAPPVPEAGWTVSGVLLGLLSTALAAGLAAVLLWPPWRAGAGRLGRPPVAVLHRLHSGHLGDYVAWLVLGTAAVAALLGLAP